MLRSLALSLTATWTLELAFALVAGIRNKKDLLLILCVNLITNPAVVYLALTFHFSFPAWLWVFALESAAVLIEGLYYRSYALTIQHPWLFAIAANVFSYMIGWLAQR